MKKFQEITITYTLQQNFKTVFHENKKERSSKIRVEKNYYSKIELFGYDQN
jgi:hypothetical protein